MNNIYYSAIGFLKTVEFWVLYPTKNIVAAKMIRAYLGHLIFEI